MRKRYSIEKFIFEIRYPDNMPIPANLSLFEYHQDEKAYLYEIKVSDHLIVKENSFIISKERIRIIKKDNLEKRYLYIENEPFPYAICEEMNDHHSIIYIDKKVLPLFSIDTFFVSLLSLERRMSFYHQFIFHCAYLCYQNHAILFSGPSGSGKSTQAFLWNQYRFARIINGDRCLLKQEENQFYACGWPICGSSEICINEKYPLSCIVFVSQSRENKIERLSYKESIKKIMSEMTINYHNSEFVNQAMDFIEQLSHIPVYHLECRIDEKAVQCLEEELKKEIL